MAKERLFYRPHQCRAFRLEEDRSLFLSPLFIIRRNGVETGNTWCLMTKKVSRKIRKILGIKKRPKIDKALLLYPAIRDQRLHITFIRSLPKPENQEDVNLALS